jgi:hypothetical protein
VATTASPKKARKSKAHKNELSKMDPVDMMEQLTLLEFGLYVKITPQECLAYAKTQSGTTVANLVDFCGTHDKLASWVKNSVLENDALLKRADTVDFWIKVADVSEPCFWNLLWAYEDVGRNVASTTISLPWLQLSQLCLRRCLLNYT